MVLQPCYYSVGLLKLSLLWILLCSDIWSLWNQAGWYRLNLSPAVTTASRSVLPSGVWLAVVSPLLHIQLCGGWKSVHAGQVVDRCCSVTVCNSVHQLARGGHHTQLWLLHHREEEEEEEEEAREGWGGVETPMFRSWFTNWWVEWKRRCKWNGLWCGGTRGRFSLQQLGPFDLGQSIDRDCWSKSQHFEWRVRRWKAGRRWRSAGVELVMEAAEEATDLCGESPWEGWTLEKMEEGEERRKRCWNAFLFSFDLEDTLMLELWETLKDGG